jgi:putative pyruvate formate lyase activating enzyme
MYEPSYMQLHQNGELKERARLAVQRLENCDLCARFCRVNRLESLEGAVCRTGARAVVHSCGPHHGEEDPLSGWCGSGTIFFSWCNLRCVFCQNWEISWRGIGREATAEEVAEMMLKLQELGCHNINLVSPSHVVAQVLEALVFAAERGLRLPLVYNTGGYDSLEALQLLDGIVDIYMPDMKYGNDETAFKHSKIKDYVEVNRAAVLEMHRQVGDLKLDSHSIARRGLLIRHLALPGEMKSTEQVIEFVAKDVSLDTYLNLMDQYRPCYRAEEFPPLDRPLTEAEFEKALGICKMYGLSPKK